MTKMIKTSGPTGVVRPFQPTIGDMDPMTRVVDALESIAVSLAAIDHNLDLAVRLMKK